MRFASGFHCDAIGFLIWKESADLERILADLERNLADLERILADLGKNSRGGDGKHWLKNWLNPDFGSVPSAPCCLASMAALLKDSGSQGLRGLSAGAKIRVQPVFSVCRLRALWTGRFHDAASQWQQDACRAPRAARRAAADHRAPRACRIARLLTAPRACRIARLLRTGRRCPPPRRRCCSRRTRPPAHRSWRRRTRRSRRTPSGRCRRRRS